MNEHSSWEVGFMRWNAASDLGNFVPVCSLRDQNTCVDQGRKKMKLRALALGTALLAATVPSLSNPAEAAPWGWHGGWGGWHGGWRGGWGWGGLGLGLAAG